MKRNQQLPVTAFEAFEKAKQKFERVRDHRDEAGRTLDRVAKELEAAVAADREARAEAIRAA